MSLNDPQWGKRGNQSGGPPDLDEIWRNVNRRMNELFGRKREPQEGGEGGRPRASLPLGGAGMLVALVQHYVKRARESRAARPAGSSAQRAETAGEP